MKDQFVSYELAVKLKELGFDDPCLGYYKNEKLKPSINLNNKVCATWIVLSQSSDLGDNDCIAPLWQQAFSWFREIHDFDLFIKPMSFVGITQYYDIEIHHPKYVWDKPPKVTGRTYEEALLNCLQKLIELVQNK